MQESCHRSRRNCRLPCETTEPVRVGVTGTWLSTRSGWCSSGVPTAVARPGADSPSSTPPHLVRRTYPARAAPRLAGSLAVPEVGPSKPPAARAGSGIVSPSKPGGWREPNWSALPVPASGQSWGWSVRKRWSPAWRRSFAKLWGEGRILLGVPRRDARGAPGRRRTRCPEDPPGPIRAEKVERFIREGQPAEHMDGDRSPSRTPSPCR